VTNLDIHDLARLCTTYRLARFYLVTPAKEQQLLCARIINHWRQGFGASYNPDRSQALDVLQVKDSFTAALNDWRAHNKDCGLAVLTGARHTDGVGFDAVRKMTTEQPVMLVFGTGHGLAEELYTPGRPCLAAIRPGRYNHLSVRTAAAIVLDRLIGEQEIC
jgi:hypothetical protein